MVVRAVSCRVKARGEDRLDIHRLPHTRFRLSVGLHRARPTWQYRSMWTAPIGQDKQDTIRHGNSDRSAAQRSSTTFSRPMWNGKRSTWQATLLRKSGRRLPYLTEPIRSVAVMLRLAWRMREYTCAAVQSSRMSAVNA